MSNFAFLEETIPTILPDSARAESYLLSDPRAACFYGRRAIEELVWYLYDVLGVDEPYRNDLAARTNHAPFKRLIPGKIHHKLNLIRTIGNEAAHEYKVIAPHRAQQVLHDLHHVTVWAAFHHSPKPQQVPLQSTFDPAIAKRRAPLSRSELVKLAERIREQDEAYARALAEKDAELAEREATIAELREQIAAAQAARATVGLHDTRNYDEARTRTSLIDEDLHRAGWNLDKPRDREYKVTGMPPAGGIGFVDYVLWGHDGLPLAVIEAKATAKSAESGQQQAEAYADCLHRQFGRRPLIYYTNGSDRWLWDDDGGYPPREVAGFHTRDELELLIARRTTRKDLTQTAIDETIAGRYYQTRAIRAVGEAFTQRQRDALLVMATGSGKTRTVIALVDQLMRANWVKRVLFLADRNALVNQATEAFKQNLTNVTTVNLVAEKITDGRVFVSTYPTMINLLGKTDDEQRSIFGPGYFDLVVIDEAHRSIYAKYGEIFDYLDSLIVGLTATPKAEVDHNTYRRFHLEDGVPTDAYSLEEAVTDQYLVPPQGVEVGTTFMRRGIHYDELSQADQEEWDALDWGEDTQPPDAVDAAALNRFLFNADTVDKVLATLMDKGVKVDGADRLGKTIIFANNQRHAHFIVERFLMKWHHLGHHFAQVITHATHNAEALIANFKQPEKPPYIAVSVDMLDTGLDVPEVANLVFFKRVMSKTKFWQMIGRGTRLRPDLFGPGQDKTHFLVFDICGNLEFFRQNLPNAPGSVTKSLSQRIFEERLALIAALATSTDDGELHLREQTTGTLHAVVAGMDTNNVLVRLKRGAVTRLADADAWDRLTPEDLDQARALAGLPSAVVDSDERAKRFDLLILRRQLAQLDGDDARAGRLREAITSVAELLLTKTTIPDVVAQAELLEAITTEQWWADVTLPMLETARKRLRSLMHLTDKASTNPIYTDFADELSEARDVHLPGITPGTDFERFRAKATAYLKAHEDHVALQRLYRNRPLTSEDLQSLEQMLLDAGGDAAVLQRANDEAGGLGLFIRSLVGLDRAAVVEAFSRFLDQSTYSERQIRFVNRIVDELTAAGNVEPGRLFESPFTDHAPRGPIDLFPPGDTEQIVAILSDVKSRAVPEVA